MPLGSGVVVIKVFTGSPGPRQHPFGSGQSPVSGQLSKDIGGGADLCSWFPVVFRRTGVRFLGHPVSAGWSAFLTVSAPNDDSVVFGPNGIAVFRTSETRPGRAPPISRDTAVFPGRGWVHRPAPAAFQRPVLPPRWHVTSARLTITRHHRGFTYVHPSGLPLRLWPPDATDALGLDHL